MCDVKGLLHIVANSGAAGELPIDLIIKTSVMMAPTNPASARIIELLGANTINIPSDLTISQIGAIRAAIDTPIDFYVEAPDNIGGFFPYYNIPQLTRARAPTHLTFRFCNPPPVSPRVTPLDNTLTAASP